METTEIGKLKPDKPCNGSPVDMPELEIKVQKCCGICDEYRSMIAVESNRIPQHQICFTNVCLKKSMADYIYNVFPLSICDEFKLLEFLRLKDNENGKNNTKGSNGYMCALWRQVKMGRYLLRIG